ncbi:MAG: Asp-tRNA(Asn)/Glu-tRNA(Gln) amidotransferase subunit GatC [Candidatus Omnitrophota bacterium]
MVNKKIVDYVAALARINVSEEEKEHLAGQLSDILAYIDKLKELNVDGVETTRGAFSEENILRKDIVDDKKLSGSIMKNAPSQEEGCFKIPQVIE